MTGTGRDLTGRAGAGLSLRGHTRSTAVAVFDQVEIGWHMLPREVRQAAGPDTDVLAQAIVQLNATLTDAGRTRYHQAAFRARPDGVYFAELSSSWPVGSYEPDRAGFHPAHGDVLVTDGVVDVDPTDLTPPPSLDPHPDGRYARSLTIARYLPPQVRDSINDAVPAPYAVAASVSQWTPHTILFQHLHLLAISDDAACAVHAHRGRYGLTDLERLALEPWQVRMAVYDLRPPAPPRAVPLPPGTAPVRRRLLGRGR